VLARDGDASPLHFYIGNLTNMRKEVFPGLVRAYEAWFQSGDTAPLVAIAETGAEHWERIAGKMIAIHRDSPADAAGRIRTLVSESYLWGSSERIHP
jgi:hypothetical protein